MLKVGGEYKTEIQASVIDEVDVIIAGGGTAGVVAAIAAARNGANALLVERYGFLGGMMTAGNAGLTKYIVHDRNQAEYRKIVAELSTAPSKVQVVGGITMEISNRLLKTGAGIGTNGQAGSYIFTAQEDFKLMLLTMMEEAGVKLLFHSLIVDIIKENSKVKGVVVENKSGRQVYLARIFVDATGDGDVAAKAGVPFFVGVGPDDLSAKADIPLESSCHMGVLFRAGNIDMERCFEYLRNNPDKYIVQSIALMSLDEAYESFKKGDMMVIIISGVAQIYNTPIPGVFTFCCPSYEGCGLSVKDQTQGEIVLLKQVHKYLGDMRKSLPGFEKSYLLDCPEICTRETRHIQGEYKLTAEDVLGCREFEDTIGRGSHPLDVFPVPEELAETPLPSRWSFSIPYRILIAKKIDNLLTAGRCVSATHEASGSLRPAVQCMITGEAAGTAAAMCASQNVNPRELNIKKLSERLKEQGVVL